MIAKELGQAAPLDKTVLIDAFAGVGGNTIAFAKSGRWEQIFAIEKDAATLKCAKHNAEIYGVSKKIWWTEGDCLQTLKKKLAAMGKTAADIESVVNRTHEACIRIIDKQFKPMENFADRDHCVQVNNIIPSALGFG